MELLFLPHRFQNLFVGRIECVASILQCVVSAEPRIVDRMCMCIGQPSADGCRGVAPKTPVINMSKEEERKQNPDKIKTIVFD